MKSNLVVALVASVLLIATGCAAGNMNARLDRLEGENMALRRQNAQLHQGQATQPVRDSDAEAPPLVALPEKAAASPVTGSLPTAGMTVSRAWVRVQHGAYLCFVNDDPHLSMGDRIRFENRIHDNYGMVTASNTVANKWVSIRLNGEPVMMLRPTVAGYVVGFHLGPDETCTAEIGGATNISLVSELYKNKLGSGSPVLVPTGVSRRREIAVNPMNDLYPVTFDRFTFR